MTLILCVVAAAVVLFLVLQRQDPQGIYRKFGLKPGEWELLSSDLGKGHARSRIGAYGVAGEPDALFRGARTGQVVVGEFKNRRYRGFVRRREFYQVILYVGLAREALGATNVVGILAFNDSCVEIAHDEQLFRALIALRGEVLGSLKRRSPINDRPLHKRMSVTPRNRKVRFLT